MIDSNCAKTANIGGMTADYLSFGNGDKQMVVIPGLSIKKITQSGAALKNTFKKFTNDFTVTILDVKDNPESGYKVHDVAEDTIKVLDFLGINKAYFFGNSLGGMILQDILVNHPERVIKGVLSSTVAYVKDGEGVVQNWVDLADSGKGRELATAMLDTIFSETFLNRFRELLLTMYREITPEELRKVSILANACRGFDLRDKLALLPDTKKASVMVIGTAGDKVFPVDRIVELADLLSCERYIYGPEYGHSVCDEDLKFYDRVYDYFIHRS